MKRELLPIDRKIHAGRPLTTAETEQLLRRIARCTGGAAAAAALLFCIPVLWLASRLSLPFHYGYGHTMLVNARILMAVFAGAARP